MIIAISGKIGSGKTTLSKIILEKYPSFKVKSFATKLKQVVAILCNVPYEMTLTQEGKNTHIPMYGKTLGEMLQCIGSDVMCKHFDQRVWAKVLADELSKYPDEHYIIDDLRFKNEMDILETYSVFTVRINRSIENNTVLQNTKRNPNHISETDLDDYADWGIVIDNDGDLKELQSVICNFIDGLTV